eukprot:CAMPEP_0174332866 /NCGR_PEP_ID=MMETSP0810-20121108/18640_1 /TAXON_ID=73025 ORGANISM="Eutreptiella gymnastica-like, Strain CCMP1594" /NCGR_SAMPLE_ID=MMETSP0810 /ASSEMBLY_ACC=CAM_ASM_000659 /LENGTH=229 /DNA_ID=CAMNT_0015449531 /DNA_START=152 /DNA_END=837 /DNA_ORIENTATION=+
MNAMPNNRVQGNPGGSHQSAATNLNISSILSQLGRHNEAISHAKRAVSLTEGSSLASADLSLTATAYFNLAQVLEATQAPAHRAEMEQTYAAALSIAQRDLGPNHATTMAIQKKYAGAAAKRRSPAEPDSGGSFLPQLNNSGVNTSYTAQAYDEDPRYARSLAGSKASGPVGLSQTWGAAARTRPDVFEGAQTMPSGVGPRPPMDADYAQRPLVPPQRAAAPAWTFNQP